MKVGSSLIGGMLAIGITLSATEASAQIVSCGRGYTAHSLDQYEDLLAVRLMARTSRDLISCTLELQTEAWVNGAGTAGSARGTFSAEVRLIRPVPRSGRWRSTSKHWLIWHFGLTWDYLGTEFGETIVQPVPVPTRQQLCALEGGTWNSAIQRCIYNTTPIITDTLDNGYNLTNLDEGVRFDLDADGLAEQVAWTSADSDDAFLALDRNGNGRIDDGSELFGDHTPAYADEDDPAAANGFEALKFAEGPSYGGGRADGVIDARDAVFHRLLLWRDANHNGMSEFGELQPLAQSALLSISTDYKTSRRRDKHGNEFRLRSKSLWRKPSGRVVERFVHDVWLNTR